MPILKITPNIRIKLYSHETTYVSGTGDSAVWTPITSSGNTTFFCEWKGSYGDRAMAAEASGYKNTATLRMVYNPNVKAKLEQNQVIIVKDADATAIVNNIPDEKNANVFELWGGVDDVEQAHQFLEFKVRRYAGV